MGYFRLGRYQDAVKDLDAALSASPDQTPSLYLRGVVREAMGDRGGADDVREALARDPSLKMLYGRFGIKAD
jgi:tetratricopeptide (TPR) repeat protein